ncbi:putative vacuolar carboxypeptidase Cps1 [Teratosphaeria nubilosa]|uniref:Putative vacuolar carboxypeptidase Cps1 n=1 Tax=Teratosphaeria nubilosa TaxID=161662 RepID=A0A6G1LKW2_9PEZI|nr:putative vacuolar carboxypeptidase Cps1 [Teratosphaeria nubilosa]
MLWQSIFCSQLLATAAARIPSQTYLGSTSDRQRDSSLWCHIPGVAESPRDGLRSSRDVFTGDDALSLQVERLTAAVNVPTVSYDDNGDVNEDERWLPFGRLHKTLLSIFPLVHKHLRLEKVNKYGLLYHITGTNTSLKPVVFMAHQDVVPAGRPSAWTHPPFDAFFDGEWLWGRGSADCKSNLIGILSAMESLLQQKFKPQRTIIFSFGFDEETSGYRGAKYLARHLEEKLGPNSIAMILDEGGMGVATTGDVAYALPAIAEKGFVDIVMTLETPGGHSSRPPAHTGIGIMSKLISALEDSPFYPSLSDKNPVRGVLECEAIYSDEYVEPWLKEKLQSGHDIGEEIVQSRGDSIRWQLQTSQAVDEIRGGDKDNQLPEEVNAVVNYRISPQNKVEDLFERRAEILAEVAHEHGIAVSGLGFNESRTADGILRLKTDQLLVPSPITPTESTNDVWNLVGSTLRQVYESVDTLPGVKTVIPVGSIATGNSDTSHYWNLTQQIYRFTPIREDARQGVHTVDERIEMQAHLEATRVYYDLMRKFQEFGGETCEGSCLVL